MPFTEHALPAWLGHELVPHAPDEQITWHEHELLQSIEPHAPAPVHWTVHASVPQVIDPHAAAPLQSIEHANPSGQSIERPPADDVIRHCGGDAVSVQPPLHSEGQLLLPPLPAPTQYPDWHVPPVLQSAFDPHARLGVRRLTVHAASATSRSLISIGYRRVLPSDRRSPGFRCCNSAHRTSGTCSCRSPRSGRSPCSRTNWRS